jgi:metal-responsive CopG/Arc/MetJ family transcriptional regulator
MEKTRNDTQIAVRLPLDLVAMLDEMRRDEKDIPARTEMMRRLIERAYDAKLATKSNSESLCGV